MASSARHETMHVRQYNGPPRRTQASRPARRGCASTTTTPTAGTSRPRCATPFTCSLHGTTALVVLHFSDKEASVRIDPPYVDITKLKLALANYTDEEATKPLVGHEIRLRGYEGRIYL